MCQPKGPGHGPGAEKDVGYHFTKRYPTSLFRPLQGALRSQDKSPEPIGRGNGLPSYLHTVAVVRLVNVVVVVTPP